MSTYQPIVKRRCVSYKLIIVLHIVISVAEFFHCVSVCERACVCVCVFFEIVQKDWPLISLISVNGNCLPERTTIMAQIVRVCVWARVCV